MKVLYLTKDFIYTYEDGRIVRDEYKPIKTKDYVTALLPYNKAISLNFKITAENEEDLLLKAEDYIYQEGALSEDKEYKVNFFFHKENEDQGFYFVESAVVDIETLTETFENFVKDFKYIDYIGFSAAVFEEYYNLSGDEKKNDLFIYFDKDDSFVSYLRDGDFIFAKALNKFSLLKSYMQVDDDLVIQALEEEGIVDLERAMNEGIDAQYPMIAQFFEEYFTKIMHIVSQTISYYKIEKIDRIFFYSPFKIKYLEEFFYKKAGDEIEFKFYELKTDYDPFDITAVHYNVKHLNDENLNFSIFLRPPPIYKTKFGQFLLFSICGFLFIAGDAAYKLVQINSYEKKIEKYKKIYSKKKQKIAKYKKIIKKYDDKINKLVAENLEYKKKIDKIYKDLVMLDEIDSSPLLFNKLVKLDKLYKKYNLQVKNFKKIGNSYQIILKSDDINGNSIVLFMKELLKLNFKNISSKEITKDTNSYIAEVKFDE